MQTSNLCRIERNDLLSMLSTLCSYQNLFGPFHPYTLHLMAEAGVVFWQYGECVYARPLLERAVRDLGRYLGREHEARLRAITALRDLLMNEGDYERARAIQTELLVPKAPARTRASRDCSRSGSACYDSAGNSGSSAWARNLRQATNIQRLGVRPGASLCG